MFNYDESTFVQEHNTVINELRSFENNTPFQPQIVQLVAGVPNQIDISYGAYNTAKGTIRMQRGNYQIISHIMPNGTVANLPNYNYTGDGLKKLSILTSGIDNFERVQHPGDV